MATEMLLEQLKDTIVANRKAVQMAEKDISEYVRILRGAQVIVKGKASEKGTLFEALSEHHVIDAVMKAFLIPLTQGQITMKPLKKVGDHMVGVQLGKDLVELKVVVEGAKSSSHTTGLSSDLVQEEGKGEEVVKEKVEKVEKVEKKEKKVKGSIRSGSTVGGRKATKGKGKREKKEE